jgi:uncharacterized membrane protein YkgB
MTSSRLPPGDLTLRHDVAGADRRIEQLGITGVLVLRYGLVLLLLMWGAFKFAAFEAEAIRPLVENSPLLGWLYGPLSVRGTSALFGVFEVTTALLIASRPWLPRVSGYASLAAAGMFVVTLSFLFTTPGVLEPTNPFGGFLMKDLMLLGAALFTASEALRAGTTAETVLEF